MANESMSVSKLSNAEAVGGFQPETKLAEGDARRSWIGKSPDEIAEPGSDQHKVGGAIHRAMRGSRSMHTSSPSLNLNDLPMAAFQAIASAAGNVTTNDLLKTWGDSIVAESKAAKKAAMRKEANKESDTQYGGSTRLFEASLNQLVARGAITKAVALGHLSDVGVDPKHTFLGSTTAMNNLASASKAIKPMPNVGTSGAFNVPS